jgi:hypothetical protein
LAEPAWARLAQFEPLDQHLLECVELHERALFEYDATHIDLAWIVAQIATAWPRARIAACVSDLRTGKRLQQRLGQCGVSARLTHHGDGRVASQRVVITPYTMSAFWSADHVGWDIVICMDARRATALEPSRLLTHSGRARLYGLLAVGTHVSSRDVDLMRGLFGFRRVALPRHGHVEIPVEVAFTRITGGPRDHGFDVVNLKRRVIWHNSVRNRRLVRLAGRFAHGDQRAVAAMCAAGAPFLADRPGPCNVVILTESEEHHQRLIQELRRPQHQLPLRTGFGREPHVRVKTFETAKEITWPLVDVLIRADGGIDLPPYPEAHSLVTPCGADQRLLLVDVDDRDVPALRARSQRRKRGYMRRGWLPVGADPVAAQVDQFLADRIGRT